MCDVLSCNMVDQNSVGNHDEAIFGGISSGMIKY